MSIDFPCSQCQRTIRVPDGSEGKKTKCPKCDAVQRIPGGAADRAGSSDASQGETGGNGKDPLWEDVSSSPPPSSSAPQNPPNYAPAPNPFGETAPNPYASPTATAAGVGMATQATRENAKSTLMGPAIATMVVVILGVLGHAVLFAISAVNMQEQMQGLNVENQAERIGFYIGFFGVPVVMTILGVISLFAMTRALQVRNYGLVFTGFILAMIPCTTGYCCVLSLPFSIWGIVVLLDDSVKAAFRLP